MTDTAPSTVPPWTSRRPARLVAVGIVVVLSALAWVAPFPAYVLSPGPVFPLSQAVTIEGAEPVDGDFLFTTVQLGAATVGSALRAGFDPDQSVVSRAGVLRGLTEEAFVAAQAQLFDDTEALAVGLGLSVVGSDLLPSAVTVDAEGVGGPSAGLLIALAVADLASPLDVAGGRLVAGTGTVEADGTIGAVGGVADKVIAAEQAGAQVFLVASGQVEEARASAVAMAVLGVDDLAGAVALLSG